jgi:hypothetical protein
MDVDDAMVDGTTEEEKPGSLWVFLLWSQLRQLTAATHTVSSHTGH